MPALCATAPWQKEDRDRHNIWTLWFFTCAWELGAWCYEGTRDQTMCFRKRAGIGQKLWQDAQLLSCAVWDGDWPLWSLNSWNVSMSPIDTTGMVTFHPSNPKRCLPSLPQPSPIQPPGPIQPSGPAWFLLQPGECHGNASVGMLTYRHAQALVHTHASSLLLPSLPCMLFLLSVLLSYPSSTEDLVKAHGSPVL